MKSNLDVLEETDCKLFDFIQTYEVSRNKSVHPNLSLKEASSFLSESKNLTMVQKQELNRLDLVMSSHFLYHVIP